MVLEAGLSASKEGGLSRQHIEPGCRAKSQCWRSVALLAGSRPAYGGKCLAQVGIPQSKFLVFLARKMGPLSMRPCRYRADTFVQLNIGKGGRYGIQ